MASGKFAQGGTQPQTTPPVCKKQPNKVGFEAVIIALPIVYLQWYCQCPDKPFPSGGGGKLKLAYNPGADQYIGIWGAPGSPAAMHIQFDHAPPPYCSQLSWEIKLDCGDTQRASIVVCPKASRAYQFGLLVATKHCFWALGWEQEFNPDLNMKPGDVILI